MSSVQAGALCTALSSIWRDPFSIEMFSAVDVPLLKIK
jgi:hypothetical protein